MIEESDLKGVIWWCCFLESDDRIYDDISLIGDDLKLRGQQLVVIGRGGDYSRCTGFVHIEVPISLAEQGRTMSNLAGPSVLPMSATALPELINAEEIWGQAPNTPETEFYVLRALRFWEKAFETMRPSVILAWGSTLPFSKMLLRLAQVTQTPSYAMERGLTEGTLMMSLLGQAQISNIGMRLQFIEPVIPKGELDVEWSDVEKYYRRPQPDVSLESRVWPNDKDGASVKERGPTILYLGAFDIGSGMSFHSIRAGDRYSSWVYTSKEGAVLVAKSLMKNFECSTLIVKPHPTTSFVLPEEFPGVNIVDGSEFDFQSLIMLCDICVTSISTTQIYGFIYGKPVVTLANGFFTGRHITYEAIDEPSLDRALVLAFERSNWEEKLARAKALIVALFREEFIGIRNNVPGRLTRSHLVEHLARFVNYRHPSTESASKRIDQFWALEAFSTNKLRDWCESDIAFVIGPQKWTTIERRIRQNTLDKIGAQIWNDEPNDDPWLDNFISRIRHEVTQRIGEAQQLLNQAAEMERNKCTDLSEQLKLLVSQITDLMEENKILHEGLDKLWNDKRQDSYENEQKIEAVTAKLLAAEKEQIFLEKKLDIAEFNVCLERSNNNDLRSETEKILSHYQLVTSWMRANYQRRIRRRKYSGLNSFFGFEKKSEDESIDPVEYILSNPDVAEAGFDPDVHWKSYGKREGRGIVLMKN